MYLARLAALAEVDGLAMARRVIDVGCEIGLVTFGAHAAGADSGLIAREVAPPGIDGEWSILWPARAPSAAVARFLESARRCADQNHWLRSADQPTSAATETPSPARL